MAEAALSETGIEPAHAVMIGDTVFDMEMAANSGMRALGVDWGYHPAEELMAAGAEMVASEPRHITEHLLS
jgi:phosphoglycolate phosphatase